MDLCHFDCVDFGSDGTGLADYSRYIGEIDEVDGEGHLVAAADGVSDDEVATV